MEFAVTELKLVPLPTVRINRLAAGAALPRQSVLNEKLGI